MQKRKSFHQSEVPCTIIGQMTCKIWIIRKLKSAGTNLAIVIRNGWWRLPHPGLYIVLPCPTHSLVKNLRVLIHCSFNFHPFEIRLETCAHLRVRNVKIRKKIFLSLDLLGCAAIALSLRGSHLLSLSLNGWKLKEVRIKVRIFN